MEPARLDDIVLALLFASDEPLSANRIQSVLDDVSGSEVRDCLERLAARYGSGEAAIRLEHIAGGFQLCTNPAYSDYVARLYRGRRKQRLSRAALEALAIIAYRQPVTRADIETVRGVACGGVITTLMERALIRIVGKAKVLGAPFLYGTTQEFLEYLGLNSLGDLPSLEDLEALLEKEAAAESAAESVEGGSEIEPASDNEASEREAALEVEEACEIEPASEVGASEDEGVSEIEDVSAGWDDPHLDHGQEPTQDQTSNEEPPAVSETAGEVPRPAREDASSESEDGYRS